MQEIKKIENKVVCVSGKFENYSQQDMEQFVKDNGGAICSSVTTKTDMLVVGDLVDETKLSKAKELGVRIVAQDVFLKMLKEEMDKGNAHDGNCSNKQETHEVTVSFHCPYLDGWSLSAHTKSELECFKKEVSSEDETDLDELDIIEPSYEFFERFGFPDNYDIYNELDEVWVSIDGGRSVNISKAFKDLKSVKKTTSDFDVKGADYWCYSFNGQKWVTFLTTFKVEGDFDVSKFEVLQEETICPEEKRDAINTIFYYNGQKLSLDKVRSDGRSEDVFLYPVNNVKKIINMKKEFKINDVTFNMVLVKAGKFVMGSFSDTAENEGRFHVTLTKDYYIGETLVTQALWKAVMGENPSEFKCENNPVENISWEDCQIFIKKLNSLLGKQFRLPTEAEWEFAARGGIYSQGFTFAGSDNLDEVAWHDGDVTSDSTHPVALKKPNELGLYDMTGNVYEYCNDWFTYDEDKQPQIDPQGPDTGSERVLRGGGWLSTPRSVFNISVTEPDYCSWEQGLRLALTCDENGESKISKNEKDKSEFLYNGNIYTKKIDLVKSVIKDIIDKLKPTCADDLEILSMMQGKLNDKREKYSLMPKMIVGPTEIVKDEKRYFEQLLPYQNTVIKVSNQWGIDTILGLIELLKEDFDIDIKRN